MPDFSVKPTLIGQRVLLRPFQDSDFDGLRAALRDPEAARLTGSVTSSQAVVLAQDPTRERRLREWYSTRNAQTDRLDLAVVDVAGGACVGEVVLNKWDPDNLCCNFRTLIGPGGRDRGLGTEAIRMFIGYGFEQLHLHRISLEVFAFNPRARRVYEKVGFVAEGVLRDALRFDGRWVDATVMSVLAPEWARHRGRP
ncbi:GNAT family protein [Catellatospora sp. KI3]|uniref:GNAT family N-acetyltransferase n=1 Tax=Catellatospora sp. KI3 TaxID=3041620 RepID=UPI002482D948|nr:GNAT family protein [Catellatospora sp. KI3]MDI1463665.1 GNAT family protein [Catellatospora sp. KI3]